MGRVPVLPTPMLLERGPWRTLEELGRPTLTTMLSVPSPFD